MAQELRRDGGFGRRFFAGTERRNALLFFAEVFSLFRKSVSQTFVAGTGPAAPDEERRGLDSSGRCDYRPRSANLISARCARWCSHAERSSRTEFV